MMHATQDLQELQNHHTTIRVRCPTGKNPITASIAPLSCRHSARNRLRLRTHFISRFRAITPVQPPFEK
jgi:hypothetical protein